jgi:hypothetical protein
MIPWAQETSPIATSVESVQIYVPCGKSVQQAGQRLADTRLTPGSVRLQAVVAINGRARYRDAGCSERSLQNRKQ